MGVEAFRRLVQEQYFWVVKKGPRDEQLLAHAVGKMFYLDFPLFEKPEFLQQVRDSSGALSAPDASGGAAVVGVIGGISLIIRSFARSRATVRVTGRQRHDRKR